MSDLATAIAQADQRLEQAEQRARALVDFCDGFEETGRLTRYAQRARVTADDLLRVAGELRAERSARASIQAERDRLHAVLARQHAERQGA